MNATVVSDAHTALAPSMAILASPLTTVATTPPPSPSPSSGYELPVQGMDQPGHFDVIHITAIGCLVGSLLCAIATILLTLAANQWRLSAFYAWTTGDRVLIYMAVFDGLFNITHMMDHGLYLAQRGHVRPRQLCSFFGFALSVLVIAQNVLVCFLALEACLMVFRLRPPNFGCRDWRPLATSLGPGVLFSAVAWALDKLGPSGAFCYLDPIKGRLFLMAFTTIFLIGIGLFNLVFYSVTVIRLRIADRNNRKQLGSRTQLGRSVNKTAWTCTYFVVSFFAQWLPMILYGAWAMRGTPPFQLFMAVTTFTNLGGFFNLLLFGYIRLKKRRASHLSRQNAVRKRSAPRPLLGARAQERMERSAQTHGSAARFWAGAAESADDRSAVAELAVTSDDRQQPQQVLHIGNEAPRARAELSASLDRLMQGSELLVMQKRLRLGGQAVELKFERPEVDRAADQLRRLNGDSDTTESLAYTKVNTGV